MPDATRVTVAIPLHRGERWVSNVIGNVERLRGSADIVISDADEHDDALRLVGDALTGAPGVTLIGRRRLPEGWIAHYNDLLQRARTPLMMWLAQDDEIDRRWITGGADALERNPSAVIATGCLKAIDEADCERAGLVLRPCPRLAAMSVDERVAAAAGYLSTDWGPIGLPVRGVFRRDRALAVPPGGPGGQWADILWILAMLVRGAIVAVPGAEYGKRFYRSSEHTWWAPFARHEDAADLMLDSLLAGASGQQSVLPAVRAGWRGDREGLVHLLSHTEGALASAERAASDANRAADDLRRALDETSQHLGAAAAQAERSERALTHERLVRERAEESARTAGEALLTVVGSRSWRTTAPLRKIGAMIRSHRSR